MIENSRIADMLRVFKSRDSRWAHIGIGLLMLFGFSSCKHFESIPSSMERTTIRVGAGPEDMAFDMENGQPRLLVSCAERQKTAWHVSEFWEIDLENDEARIIPVRQLPDSIRLHTHGMDVGLSSYGKTLFVINHEDNLKPSRHMILMFKVFKDSLVYVDNLMNPLLTSPNDVCFDGNNGLFVTNDARKRGHILEQMLFKTSYVLSVDLTTKKWDYAVSELVYANGIGVSKGKLYVSGIGEKGIQVYKKTAEKWLPYDTLGTFKGADNITFYGDELYTAVHPQPVKFIGHRKNLNKNSPGKIYSLNMVNKEVEQLYEDDGTLMSAPSTAFRYKNHVYVAQVFRPYILKLPVPTNLDEP